MYFFENFIIENKIKLHIIQVKKGKNLLLVF